MRIISIFLFTCLLFLTSCSKEETSYAPTELWKLAKAVEPELELVPIPTHMQHLRILCAHYASYGDGCVPGSGKRIKVRKVELIVVRYETTEQAAKVAKKIGQWYARNWLLDDVSNEPVLENFVQKALNAKRGADWVDD